MVINSWEDWENIKKAEAKNIWGISEDKQESKGRRLKKRTLWILGIPIWSKEEEDINSGERGEK